MAPASSLLEVLAIVMGAAALTAVTARQLRLPLLFGFLAAGLLIGPHGPRIIPALDNESLTTLADLGVVLLLFALGLDFNFRRLLRVSGVALVVMLAEGLLMLWLGIEFGRLLGWARLDGLFLGAVLTMSSTVLTIKALRDLGRLERESSRVMLGVLILQDVAAILILVLIAGYAPTGAVSQGDFIRLIGLMALFLALTLFLGLLVVPRFIDWVARGHAPEVLTLTTLGLAFGYGVLSLKIGFHAGLGAFLMGALVSEAKEHRQVEAQLRPVHDMFSAVFFVSVGTLVNLDLVLVYWKPVVAIFVLLVGGKFLSGTLATVFSGYRPQTAVDVGVGLTTIGEFSLIIALLGEREGLVSDFLFPVIVAVGVLSFFTAPFLMKGSDILTRGLDRASPAALRTYVKVYTSWMERLRTRAPAGERVRRVRARRAMIVSGLVIATVLGASWLLEEFGRAWLNTRGVADPAATLTYWGSALVLILPLLFSFYQAVNRWVGSWDPRPEARGGLGLRRVVRYSIYFLSAILLGLPVLSATSHSLRGPFVTMLWLGLVSLAAILLGASIQRFHTRIEQSLHSMLQYEHVPIESPRVIQELITGDFPWDLRVETFELGQNAWAAGRKLGESQLRNTTGGSVILVERGSYQEQLPGPDTVLLPGDRLTLIGTPDQIQAARAILDKTLSHDRGAPELRLGRLYVAERSELDGVKLSDAALPSRSGLHVVAILREEKAITNPGGGERLLPGDVIFVLGPQEQIAKATRLAGSPVPPRDASLT